MQAGRILVADHNGVYVLKFLGDVRVTLCSSLDQFVESMFSQPNFVSVLIDLTEAEGLDSTTLGLLAKLSLESKKISGNLPTIVSTNEGITRILLSMGFEKVFDIHTEALESEQSIDDQIDELPNVYRSEDEVKEKVIEAHRVLMSLNAKNAATFNDLVQNLENCR